jgi:hypothetical protein
MSAVHSAAGGSSPAHFFARMLSSPFGETRLRTFTTARFGYHRPAFAGCRKFNGLGESRHDTTYPQRRHHH